MDLMPYVELVRRELAIAAEAGGDDARALADRLTAPLESAIRLTLMEALAAASAEISREMEPGSVWVRLAGRDPEFVVTAPVAAPAPATQPEAVEEAPAPGGGTSRINLRLPDEVKARVEEAAAREHISVNSWLVRAASSALSVNRPSGRAFGGGDKLQGWAR